MTARVAQPWAASWVQSPDRPDAKHPQVNPVKRIMSVVAGRRCQLAMVLLFCACALMLTCLAVTAGWIVLHGAKTPKSAYTESSLTVPAAAAAAASAAVVHRLQMSTETTAPASTNSTQPVATQTTVDMSETATLTSLPTSSHSPAIVSLSSQMTPVTGGSASAEPSSDTLATADTSQWFNRNSEVEAVTSERSEQLNDLAEPYSSSLPPMPKSRRNESVWSDFLAEVPAMPNQARSDDACSIDDDALSSLKLGEPLYQSDSLTNDDVLLVFDSASGSSKICIYVRAPATVVNDRFSDRLGERVAVWARNSSQLLPDRPLLSDAVERVVEDYLPKRRLLPCWGKLAVLVMPCNRTLASA